MTVPVAVLASGSGTNLQALLDRETESGAYRVELLATDRECGAEDRAVACGRATRRISFKDRTPDDVGGDMLEALESAGAQAVVLAGFLRLIPKMVVNAFPRRILNVHPALLPSFGGQGMYGIRVHEAVIASGARLSGPTVHYVDEHYDEGGILAQWPVPVLADDSAQTLAGRVLAVEHVLLPAAVHAVARGIASGSDAQFRWPVQAIEAGPPSFEVVRKAFESSL